MRLIFIYLNFVWAEEDEEESENLASINQAEQNRNGDTGGLTRGEDSEEIEEEDLIDLWLVRNSIDEGASQLEVLTYENKLNCVSRKQINVCSEKIESLCVYNGNQVWCIDASKCVYIYWLATKIWKQLRFV